MFSSALAFLAGIIVVQQCTELPALLVVLGLFCCACGLAFFRCWRLLFFTVGMLWAIVFASLRMQEKLPESLVGELIQVQGRVLGLPNKYERSTRFDFAVTQAKPANTRHAPVTPITIKKIRLSWYYPKQAIKSGQVWQFTVKLKRPHGRLNPGSFDYERWLFVHNIGATGYVKNKPPPRLLATDTAFKHIATSRQLIADKLDNLLGNSKHRGLIKALTIGNKNEISQQQWAIFKATGTVHLLAISGLHIGLIAGLVYSLLLTINTRLATRSPQVIAALLAIVVAIFYAALAGFSLPTQRALLMLMSAMTAIVWQRNIRPINTLAIALFVVLMVDPLAVLAIGFWLSFLAVILIIYSLSGRLDKISYWKSLLKINVVIALGLAPLLLFYFQQVSIISPLANVLSVPLISLLVVPLCLLGVVLLFISPLLAHAVFLLVDQLLQAISWVLSVMASLPIATVNASVSSYYVLVLAIVGVFILLSPKGIPARWLGLSLLLPLFFQQPEKPKIGEFRLTVLDVGQGLSAVVQTNKHLLVFDTGAKYSNHFDMGQAVVIPFLTNQALTTIDTLLISHGDNDHIGGADSIIAHMPVKKILTSVPNQLASYAPELCQSGQSWVWDQVSFELLSPPLEHFSSKNNNSCVLKISTPQLSAILTGDIEAEAEQWLVTQFAGGHLKSDVLVAPHHGSNTSSSSAFLQQVKPQIVIIPAGYRNRFAFPHPPVMERYKKIDASVFNTATGGALTVTSGNNLATVKSFRINQKKYWHD